MPGLGIHRLFFLSAAGLLLRCWGAADDQGPEIRRLIAIGADGMTTNYPDVVGAILKEEGIASY